MERLWLIFLLSVQTFAMDNLRVAFEWKQLDFEFPSEKFRQDLINKGQYIPENNLPLGLEVYKNRLFITVPRWKAGVAASLTYIDLTDASKSPKLKPYPNWDAHVTFDDSDPQEIVNPFRIRADNCGRLWVLDTGLDDLLNNTKVLRPPRLLIFDLHNDSIMRIHTIPENQIKEASFFANIAVEDHNCSNSFAYLGDLGQPGIVVYSWKTEESWRVTHHFFHIDPLAGEFNVSGLPFQWEDGIFGMALSKPDPEGYSTMYFHPMVSTNEFSVSTKYLRSPELAKDNYHAFKLLGSRGPNKTQSGASFLDTKNDVLFYTLLNLNAVACWRITNQNYTMLSQGRIYMSNVTMVFPNDLKVDANNNLWVLSDRLPKFMYQSLDPNDVNFRILTASVPDAIRGTACDSKLVMDPEVVKKYMPGIVNVTERSRPKNSASGPVTFQVVQIILLSVVSVAIKYL